MCRIRQLTTICTLFLAFGSICSGERIELDRAVDAVSGNRNDEFRIRTEALALIQKYGSEVNFKVDISIDAIADGLICISAEANASNEHKIRSFLVGLLNYMQCRSEGHTYAYSLFKYFHREEEWPAFLIAQVPRWKQIIADVAYPWIRLDLNYCAAFPALVAPFVIEVDGEFAWIFVFDVKFANGDPTPGARKFRLHALEFETAVAPAFKNAVESLQIEGVAPRTGSVKTAAWWYELRKRIHKTTGLDWQTPMELNSEVTFE